MKAAKILAMIWMKMAFPMLRTTVLELPTQTKLIWMVMGSVMLVQSIPCVT